MEQASQEADIIVKAQIAKREKEIAAEAEAEQLRRRARGEADAIFAKMEAQAKGVEELLTKQAAGLSKIVAAAGGNPSAGVQLMIADKLPELTRIQVDAIKNLKIDKVTVWDSMNGQNGAPTTANFLSGMLKSVPPLQDLFRQAGMELPDWLGESVEPAAASCAEETAVSEDGMPEKSKDA